MSVKTYQMPRKVFLDQEFLEGSRRPFFGQSRHYIDLISIGLVLDSGEEYYAICKDFDIREAYYRYDINKETGKRDYWLRDNVLKPIWVELRYMDFLLREGAKPGRTLLTYELFTELIKDDPMVSYRSFKRLVKKFGKSSEQIADEIIRFMLPVKDARFYGYYADYDWVLFCSLFGRMIDLPKGFPMFCYDLNQMLCDAADRFGVSVDEIKRFHTYPRQMNEHNAIADARWNRMLAHFIDHVESALGRF